MTLSQQHRNQRTDGWRSALDLSLRSLQIVAAWAGFRWDVETMSVGMKLIWAVLILALTIGGFMLQQYPIPLWVLATIVGVGWFVYYAGLSF
jgi:hypothetical protein